MESIMKYISRTSRCAALYRQSILKEDGLNGYQHMYITTLCRNPGISQDDLAKEIYVNKSNVARQLALLENEGFITRTQNPKDKRAMQIYPTQKAYDIYPKVMMVLSEWNEYLLEDFSPEQREIIIKMLKKVFEKAHKKIDKGEEK